ncbi:alpha-hydroxy acid oxidase [Ornithinimicrobium pekingense]|uniref:Alpha-hydroxy-acid oxidizing enzyme n=1 Tax=Ornithinimicrobium pekingense TaxID=384677 RepID=A0ABQ2F8C7_9MICO|nr:alpha-hydroxy acid oxidase [Ornithinimicrobium pekingense]GGK62272.1 alpha-hydroxy-acid oxidizing enzyme [Ornithinimicrobium pekingense]
MSPLRRRVPTWSELRPLVRLEPPTLARVAAALRRAQTIEDLRLLARRRTPRAVFDYVDGAAEGELSLARSRRAFADVEFRPRVLRDVRQVDSRVELLGVTSPVPLVLAPTGFTRMMHTQGEWAVARAAAAAGVPYTLSTMGTVSVEELAADVPDVQRWFQLYLWQDREASRELIRRAAGAGYGTLVLTVDTAVAGQRLRDVRNGLTIPPALTARTLGGMALHPRWWVDLLTSEPIEFASLRTSGGTVADLVDRMFDPGVTTDDLAWLRQEWPGQIVVKGVQHPQDAAQLVALGVDGIVLSNHGGRQLDRAVAPLDLLPEVRAAVGPDVPLLVDGGVLHGADVVAARARGADAVMVGRAYLYGLMAGGEAGVARSLEILVTQVHRTLRLLGVSRLADLGPEHAPPARHTRDVLDAGLPPTP